MTSTKLTGRLPPERINLHQVPRLPAEVVDGMAALDGLTELVSDVLDEMGIAGAIPASTLLPSMPGARIAGPALTLRNVRLSHTPDALIARRHVNRQADYEAHNLTTPGDVLVIQGYPGISNIGGMSASLGKRQGGLGAIVWGGCRDVAQSRAVGYPIWSRGVTPVTGKWRMETMEINGPVEIAGVRVDCGDLVVADESGVCFVPRLRAAEVLARARRKAAADKERMDLIAGGVPIADFPEPDLARDRE